MLCPGILNNHVAWKALFLLACGLLLKDSRYWSEGVRQYERVIKNIANDGSVAIELARDNLASNYTRMALEAILHCEILLGCRSPKVQLAICNFLVCARNNPRWVKKYPEWIKNESQRLPDELSKWEWVLKLAGQPTSCNDFLYQPTDSYVSDWCSVFNIT